MILDTNLLLRSLGAEESEQADAVRRRIASARRQHDRFTVLSATVLEVAYVLASPETSYGWGRDEVAGAIMAILDEPAFDVEHAEALRYAVKRFCERAIDLHDCLLSAIARGYDTRVLSFDRDLHRLGNAERP